MKLARLALAGLFMAGTACSSVQTVQNPAQYLTTNPEMVVVIYNDNGEVPVAKPVMRGDTLYGEWAGLNEPIKVPMDQVQRIDAVQKDPRKTALFVTGLVAAAVVTTYGFSRAVQDHGSICDYFRPDDRQCYVSSNDPD